MRRLFATLTRPGPHRVLRGDVAFAGLPGVVYTPESGLNLPAVAFGHDWLTGAERYAGLLEHLASWGIVAVAPDTERGLVPSVLKLAFDLRAALDIVTGVRLGPGRIGVHPGRLGVAGHGFGAAAAVIAAAGVSDRPATGVTRSPTAPASLQAVAAIFPTVTAPPAEQVAAELAVPGVVFSGPAERTALCSNAAQLARVWESATLRVISQASAAGLPEGRRLTGFFGLPTSDRRTQRRVRALLTGYLLARLSGDKIYRGFADPQLRLPGTDRLDRLVEPAPPVEQIAALLK